MVQDTTRKIWTSPNFFLEKSKYLFVLNYYILLIIICNNLTRRLVILLQCIGIQYIGVTRLRQYTIAQYFISLL